LCARSDEKTRWLNPAPCTAAKGMYLVGARKQEIPGATLLGNAVDVPWKWNDLIFKHPQGSDRFTKLSRAGLSGRMVSGRGERPGRHEEILPVLIVLFIV
jgi:hypothetical protein